MRYSCHRSNRLFNANKFPSISLTNGNPIVSWTGENSLEEDNPEPRYIRRVVIRKGPDWGDLQVAGNDVNYSNNNSVTSAQEKTVIVWSEGSSNPQSKWIKRTGDYTHSLLV